MNTRFYDALGDVVELSSMEDGTFEIAILEPGELGEEPAYRDGCVLEVEQAERLQRALTVFLARFPSSKADA